MREKKKKKKKKNISHGAIFKQCQQYLSYINPFSIKPIFDRKQKVFLGNFIASLVFMLERNILSSYF